MTPLNDLFVTEQSDAIRKIMIPELGHFALILALFMAAAQVAPALSRRAAVLQAALVLMAVAALLWSALTLDFTVTLVAENAHTLKPFYRNVADVFSSPAGFGMLLLGVIALRGAAVASNHSHSLVPRGFAAMGLFLLALVLFLATPFARIYPPPFDGIGYDPFASPALAAPTAQPGSPLPAFRAEGLDADEIKGPALINFFASWCAPCEAEWPALEDLSESGLRIYGISFKDSAEDNAAFLKRLGNPYIQTGADPNGLVGATFNLHGLPVSFLIDENGVIRYRHDAPLTDMDVAEIKELLQ